MLPVKTTEEQGLTLVPGLDDFLVCPMHALAVALVMQEAPCISLVSQLPLLAAPTTTSLNAGELLLEMLEAARSKTTLAGSSLVSKSTVSVIDNRCACCPNTSQARGKGGIQAYVNRFLKRVAKPAGATSNVTSHSFRRGDAQHANGDERCAAQWIFDRSSWDKTQMNKGYAYVFKTPCEDRKIARIWSGWKADEAPTGADVAVLDHGAQERLLRLQDLPFRCCMGMENARLNVSRKVIRVLTTYLIKYLPQAKALASTGLFVVLVEECLDAAGVNVAGMLASSSALNAVASMPVHESKVEEERTNHPKSKWHYAAVINELIESNRLMAARLLVLAAIVLKRPASHEATGERIQEPPVKQRKKAATNLSSTWFEWYTRMLCIWDSSDRQKKSYYCLVVAYMKPFL
ncbi:LOW QUALITY PROTEIN: hypothetical protein PHMEG_00024284 [Phytophthora megakarya]|uniref:Uncharacterized protein n=1 Tax=Phytophthora megakarya TaxID=4795 RepID=A0A225VEV8_9STRA|nr:LOW QUALITY PROTEIN: hypothetical protein PHMEG_00024284 [Phytophthora megakarya]